MNYEPSGEHNASLPPDSDALFALTMAKDTESFPVLKAFQTYLDQERERARRRTNAIVLSFISVIVILVIVFGVIFASVFGTLMKRSGDLQNQLLTYMMYGKSGTPAPALQTAPAPAQGLTKEEVLALMQSFSAQQPAPAPVTPAVPPPAATPSAVQQPAPATPPAAVVPAPSEPAPAAPQLVETRKGIFTTVNKEEQKARLEKEEAEFKARAAARKAEKEAAEKARLEKQRKETENQEMAEQVQNHERVRLSIRPAGRMKLPEGTSSDTLDVYNKQGQKFPMRVLLPVENF